MTWLVKCELAQWVCYDLFEGRGLSGVYCVKVINLIDEKRKKRKKRRRIIELENANFSKPKSIYIEL